MNIIFHGVTASTTGRMIPESSLQYVGYKNAYETTFQLHNIVVQGAA